MANERSGFCGIFACNCKLVVFSYFSFLLISTFLCFFPRLYLSHRGSVFWLIIGVFAILFQISLLAFLFILFSGFIGTLILMAMLKLVDLLRLNGTDVTRVFVSALTWTGSYYLSLVMGKGYERIKNRGVITNEYKNQENN